jgi:large subunit ribosomal protein L17
MKKLKKGRKFSRKSDQRKALLRSLSEALFLRERIKTTEAKAKELASVSERLITRVKNGGLSSRRFLAGKFTDSLSKKIIDKIVPRYKDRAGGYTRIIKIGPRKSDSANMAIIELLK